MQEAGAFSAPIHALQKKEAASKQEELDRVERAYRNLKRQEELLEASLGHISEEVKGTSASLPGAVAGSSGIAPFLCMPCRVPCR